VTQAVVIPFSKQNRQTPFPAVRNVCPVLAAIGDKRQGGLRPTQTACLNLSSPRSIF
jgi:hypothetical protein